MKAQLEAVIPPQLRPPVNEALTRAHDAETMEIVVVRTLLAHVNDTVDLTGPDINTLQAEDRNALQAALGRLDHHDRLLASSLANLMAKLGAAPVTLPAALQPALFHDAPKRH